MMYITSNTKMREKLLNEKWTNDFKKTMHVGSKAGIKHAYDRYAKIQRAALEKRMYIKCGSV